MDHRFELDNFAGPLDLLLYLVQREEVDIRSVSLINICDQYLKVLKTAKHKNIELAGEFLVLAATLMLIKARSLLPSEEVDLERELDPEAELLQQLLEYRQFKEASRDLDRRATSRKLVHLSNPAISDAGIPLEEVDLLDLVDAFRQVLQETGLDADATETISSERPVSTYIQDLLDRLHATPRMAFFEVFASSNSRIELIGFFLATLELIRFGVLTARQEDGFGEIVLEACGEVPDSLTSLLEPVTSEGVPSSE